MAISRRHALAAACSIPAAMAGCQRTVPAAFDGSWVGDTAARGHRLRSGGFPLASVQRRVRVVVVGGGVAGLAAARAFRQRGIDDVHVLEIDDQAGGNARSHVQAGMACPIGAHYLPLPTATAGEVRDWLFEIGLLRMSGGAAVADERHLCHSPQERLFFEGQWHDGLLPPHEDHPASRHAYERFAGLLVRLRREGAHARRAAFCLPTQRAAWGPLQHALDGMTFSAWLDAEGLTDARLRWYLDYCCRDDFGADASTVSAWAGVHYFASRHGFSAPGDGAAEREAVFTWPDGNAWLVRQLAAPLGERLHTGRSVWRVNQRRHAVDVLVWDEVEQRSERWEAQTVVMAAPLFVAARIVESAPSALAAAAAAQRHAPWLVANLQLDSPLLDRPGVPPAWDSVVYGAKGLGYVDAMHQSLRQPDGQTVITAYHALHESQRADLLARPWQYWAQRVLDDLRDTHPDLPRRVRRIDLTRHGHAMAIPVPGTRAMAAPGGALAALRERRGSLRFAHADLAGYSVFEEAFTAGHEAGST